jgi:two-component system, cell cycle sensor histidine kinase and response regulator CckA
MVLRYVHQKIAFVRGSTGKRLADGSVRDVVVFSSKIDIQGRSLLHSILHDISERRSLEEQLRQAQKMEAVGRLAGGAACKT